MNYKTDTHKGTYNVLHKEKYLGNRPTVYKSMWEVHVFHAMDVNPNVVKWGYECIEIHYMNPVLQKWATYYPDIFCIVKTESGRTVQYLLEIKPAKFCGIPKKPKMGRSPEVFNKRMRTYKAACLDFMVNSAKWEAAELWCKQNNVVWKILNENNTGSLFGH